MLLDSHVAVWWLTNNPRLSPAAAAMIANCTGTLVVSTASVWELEIKRASGKFDGLGLREALPLADIPILEITADDAVRAAHLPPHHADPFDRMIVAQAIERGLPLVSADAAMRAYDLRVIS
ncbi:MAG: type II toxin-antitoxin system VapC family toxin [Patulibacter sp.]